MITQPENSIIVDTQTLGNTWCLYEHLAVLDAGQPPEIIMIGVCKLNDAFRLGDGRRNSAWSAIFANGGQIMVRIVATSEYRHEMTLQATRRIQSNPPRCNARGFNLRGTARPIKCSNGQVYGSQKEAAAALGLDASSISRHMRGDTQHVSGYTFMYSAGDQDLPYHHAGVQTND